MTLTKEWLLTTIAELVEERDATPGSVNEDAAMALAAMKRALASLEAEAMTQVLSSRAGNDTSTIDKALPEGTMLYTAPPAQVSDSLLSELLGIAKRAADAADECAHAEWSDDSMEHSTAIADWERRAAMLHGAERVTTGNKLPAIGWLRADYQDDNRGLRGNAPLFVLGKKDPSTVWGLDYVPLTSNSPVIPDGVCPCCGRKQLKNRTCSVSGCDEKHIARGFCIKHYAIERKKDPSRRESIRAADKRYRARKAAAPKQEVK
ncbi:hypothetical protein [Enterobacter hormaechei]|uniref:hypothetical protein n=1 Tax=Enterobacter hormaechei TaxID=158836 RepID=UPI0033473486